MCICAPPDDHYWKPNSPRKTVLNTFAALRQKDNERNNILQNTCFVNGITRVAYDDMALQGVPGFDHLNKIDQDPW